MKRRDLSRFSSPHTPRCAALLLATLTCLLPATPVAAQSSNGHRYDDVIVTVTSPARAQTTHGYAEYRIHVTNHSSTDAHRVMVRLTGRGGSGHRIAAIRRTLPTLEPGASAQVSLLQPPLPLNGSQLQVNIDGQWQDQDIYVGSTDHSSRRHHWLAPGAREPIHVLVGRDVSDTVLSKINSEINVVGHAVRGRSTSRRRSTTSSGREGQAVRAAHPARNWPRSWLAHTRFDALVVTADELQDMPLAAREAIWRYVTCGGQLLVLSETLIAPPEPWNQWALKEADDIAPVYAVGFGRYQSMAPDELSDLKDDGWQALVDPWHDAAATWQEQRSVEQANDMLPVVEEFDVPVRTLLGVVMVFALLIGPVNLFVLSRMNRRIWMLWTAPALALVFSAVVFGSALVAEGWHPVARSRGLTLLDQRTHRASSIGWIGYYAPLTPGGGLRFSRDTELNPQVGGNRPWNSGGQPRVIDWSVDQHLAAGWVTARVPAHFQWRRSEQRRERVTIRRQGDAIYATNGLGAPIQSLHYADADGRMHHADHIDAGAEARLERISSRAEASSDQLARVYESRNWPLEIQRLTNNHAARHLRPKTYVAVLNEPAPFIEPGLDHLREHRSDWVVYGLLDPSDAENAEGGASHGN